MNDLEQRLTHELGDLGAGLDPPYVDVSGLAAAGRRERVRRRAVTGVLAGAAAVVLALGVAVVLPGGGSDDPAPAGPTAGSDARLDRPLELPWWDSDLGMLRIGDEAIPADATRIVRSGGVTLVEQGRGSWWTVDGGELRRLSPDSILGAPVVGVDGAVHYAVGEESGGYALWWQDDRQGAGVSLAGREVGAVSGVLPDRRVLVTGRDGIRVWDLDDGSSREVTGLPAGAATGTVPPAPGALAVTAGGRVVVGDVDEGGRFRAGWDTEAEGVGAWSADGSQYADAADGVVRVSTRAGTVGVPLEASDLRVVGWESGTEVVVAQYLEEDESVTGLWRCSAVELRCAAVQDAPGGRVLPGL